MFRLLTVGGFRYRYRLRYCGANAPCQVKNKNRLLTKTTWRVAKASIKG